MAEPPRDESPPGIVWTPWVRGVATAAIVLHLLAVFTSPWSGPPPSSQVSQAVAGLFRPYQRALFLNHGYRFFAPNPGPGQLVRYTITLPDGEQVHGQIPDRNEQWPRLYYHRHLILAGYTHSAGRVLPREAFETNVVANLRQTAEALRQQGHMAEAALVEQELRAAREAHRRDTQRAQALVEGIARELLTRHGGERIQLETTERRIPFVGAVRTGRRVDDDDLLEPPLPLGEFTAAELGLSGEAE